LGLVLHDCDKPCGHIDVASGECGELAKSQAREVAGSAIIRRRGGMASTTRRTPSIDSTVCQLIREAWRPLGPAANARIWPMCGQQTPRPYTVERVDEREAGERSRRLLRNVERTCELLIDSGDRQWVPWFDAVHRQLMAHDAHGLDRLLSGFGGMGSFNDLVIHPLNGHSVADQEVGPVNDELDRLRSVMYEDTRTLLHYINHAR
jgi:hypothetical protein